MTNFFATSMTQTTEANGDQRSKYNNHYNVPEVIHIVSINDKYITSLSKCLILELPLIIINNKIESGRSKAKNQLRYTKYFKSMVQFLLVSTASLHCTKKTPGAFSLKIFFIKYPETIS